ncbi:MAG: hypothetical protein MUC83_07715 [Pirellula sp.]|jgi:hypothetical protein|nr:hypothetical protein [Pirellula sp.]
MITELLFATWKEQDSKLTFTLISCHSDLVEASIRLVTPYVNLDCTAYFSYETIDKFLKCSDSALVDCDHRISIAKKKHEYKDGYSVSLQFASNAIDFNRQFDQKQIVSPHRDERVNSDEVRIYRSNVHSDDVERFLCPLRNLLPNQ